MSQELYFQIYPWLHLAGRVLFSLVFIGSGIYHLVKLNDTAAHHQSDGLPAAKLSVAVGGLVMLAGGVMVLLGWHRFIGAGLLAIFLLLRAFAVHAFWKAPESSVKAAEMAHFLKDISLAGAALFFAAYGGTSWPMSLGG